MHETHGEQFVDKDSATISHDQELIIEHDSNHRDLCLMLGGTRTPDKIFESLYRSLDDARRALAKESPRCECMTLC